MIENQEYMFPTSRKEMQALGWDQADIILVSGDAFVDHPAFGAAVLARMLQSDGFRVAVVPQPNWQDDLRDFKKLGEPRLFFGVTAGNMDSMVNHYTANKRLRSDDAYTAGGKAGSRPDYATIAYSKIIRKLFPEKPIFIGGIEASMRRFTHYDYWQGQLRNGILADSQADLLFFGMAEYPLLYASQHLRNGEGFSELKTLNQIQYLTDEKPDDAVVLHSHEECLKSKKAFAENFVLFERNANSYEGKTMAQQSGEKWIVANPQSKPLTEKKLDKVYNLPYTRKPHPRYQNKGEIPAFSMIQHSVNIHRGCFGGCAFCTIAAHQGKWISSRSEKSIQKEISKIAASDDFKGHISDLGGPSANMYRMHGIDMNRCKKCKRPSCIFPTVCDNLNTSHEPLTHLYAKVRKNHQVKRVSIGSGIRYDLIFGGQKKYRETGEKYLEDLVTHHVSGRLKVAPEHTQDSVLKIMRKPSFKQFHQLKKQFSEINKKHGLKQQLIPYFISSHPGCTIPDMISLSAETNQSNLITDQVQDFTPTPMTLATVMFYTGLDPYTGEELFVAKSGNEKLAQRKYFFVKKKENQQAIRNDLKLYRMTHLESKLFGQNSKKPRKR